MYQNYVPENILSTPITLFQTEETFQKQNSSKIPENSTLGWSEFADSGVEIHIVPGNHMSMLGEPYVKVVAEKLQQSISQAMAIFSN